MERREREDWRPPWESDQRADRSTRSVRIRIIGSLTSNHSSPCRGFFPEFHVRPFSLSLSRFSLLTFSPNPTSQIEISVPRNILNEIKQFLNQVFRIPFPVGKRRSRARRFPIPISFILLRIVGPRYTNGYICIGSKVNGGSVEGTSVNIFFPTVNSVTRLFFLSPFPFQLFSIPPHPSGELFSKKWIEIIIRKTHASELERANRDINSSCVPREFDFDKLGSKDAERSLFLFLFFFFRPCYPPPPLLLFSIPGAKIHRNLLIKSDETKLSFFLLIYFDISNSYRTIFRDKIYQESRWNVPRFKWWLRLPRTWVFISGKRLNAINIAREKQFGWVRSKPSLLFFVLFAVLLSRATWFTSK